MFMHSFIHNLKFLSRQKLLIFWSLIFPIILGIFFKLALGGIDDASKFNAVPVAVNEQAIEDKNFQKFLNNMQDEKLLKINYVLEQNSVDYEKTPVYIKSEDEMTCQSSGINETIVQSIMDSYLQYKSMFNNIIEKNPTADLSGITENKNHIDEGSRGEMKMINVFFYTLVGMQMMYGYSLGLNVIYQYEANLSTKAKRNAVSPVKKSAGLAAATFAAFIMNFAIVLFTMFIFNKFLSVDFSNDWEKLLLLIIVGSFTGVLFGMFLGVSNKARIETKTGMGIGITMLFSYMAGMMTSDIKIIIQEKIPILNKINPVCLITDSIYSLYYYQSKEKFFQNLLLLTFISLSIFVIIVLLARRKQYDSL